MDWNKVPRDEVERAAEAGDEAAVAALRIHERLDRIEQNVRECRIDLAESSVRFQRDIDAMVKILA